MTWDYIFVGAGPSALAAANELANGGNKILLIEKGDVQTKRGCAGLKRATCTNCFRDGCRVTEGIGGSSAGFGNKLCYFPASDGVRRTFPMTSTLEVDDAVSALLGKTLLPNAHANVFPYSESGMRKFYASDVLLRGEYQAFLHNIICSVEQKSTIRSSTNVTDISRSKGNGFTVSTSQGDKFLSKNVVLATGRAGHRFLRQLLTKLDIRTLENRADIGFRLEADIDSFNPDFFYQADAKYKFDHGDLGSSRTFCSCVGGEIVPVKYGRGYFADGAFGGNRTNKANVALMVRGRNDLADDAIDDWCREVNQRSQNSLEVCSVQWDGVSDRELASVLSTALPIWPSDTHRVLMHALLDKVVAGSYVKMFRGGSGMKRIRVFGPSVDLYWPRPELDQCFETLAPGVFVIGDATGVSRGIVQALSTGIAWALGQTGSATVSQEMKHRYSKFQ